MYAHAGTVPNITDIRFENADLPSPKIILSLDQQTLFRAEMHDSPPRLALSFPDFDWSVSAESLSPPDWIPEIRIDSAKSGEKTLILPITETMVIDQLYGLPETEGMSLTLLLKRTDKNNYKNNINVSHGPLKPKIKEEERKQAPEKPFTLILDPGHGGRDPGAVGYNGLREKDVVLNAAKKLKQTIEAEYPDITIHLTRDEDIFIPLYERIAIAHRHKADLFLSLHADSLTDSTIRGASIYTLSDRATDPQTAELAMRENRAGLMDGLNLPSEDLDIAGMLVDLAYTETVEKSELQAGLLEQALRQNSAVRLLPGPHRKAAFAVLRAPDIPSLLVEIGFMSNPKEAEWMSNPDNLKTMMQSIAASIDRYRHSVTDH